MKWYLKVVKENYANFTGRARREEYWMFVLFNMIFAFAIAFVSIGLGLMTELPLLSSLYFIYVLGIIVPSLAVTVRRLHDTGKSGWFFFVALIPVVGGIWLLVLLITEGDKGTNAYGPDPKEAVPADVIA
ncbi:DUF805 domain-containing protein [Winogradskyella wichelsiae]|uniref:DUF805 domain-containing protein n=1 Tax=Winogradskyella wichelsiae TaxID=2697007 RepID=UPI003EF1E3FA